MNEQSIDPEHFKRLLIELRAELQNMDEAGEAAAQTVELDQTRMGRLSRMDALQAQAMSQAVNRRRAETLRGVESALQRLERGEYGECQECDETINPKRLEFDPTVRLCIACAEGQGA
jgi:DnaK suppressor protein